MGTGSKLLSKGGRHVAEWMAVALLAFCCCAAVAQEQSKPADAPAKLPKFEVASVRLIPPGGEGLTSIDYLGLPRFSATNATFPLLVEMAFDVSPEHIEGAPSWFESQEYSIDAKTEDDAALTYEQMKPLLQELLKERFHLAVHRKMKDFQGYALVVAKNGPKLTATKNGSTYAYIFPNRIQAQNSPVTSLPRLLESPLGQPVADETGLKGNYDIVLNYAPMNSTDSDLPSIFTAIEEQLGLKLEKRTVPVEMIVIDHVDREPAEN